MAEARSAVSYRVEKPNLLLQVTEDEVILRISKDALPSSLGKIRRALVRKAYRTKNNILNAFYPAPPLHWAFLVSAPAAVMLLCPSIGDNTAPSTLISLAQPISSFLWNLERFIPSSVLSLMADSPLGSQVSKAATISLSVGTSAILCLSYLRRVLLSSLLSYQGWLYDNPKERNIKTLLWGVCIQSHTQFQESCLTATPS